MTTQLKSLVLFVALGFSVAVGLLPQLLDESSLSWSPVLLTLLGATVGLLSLARLATLPRHRQLSSLLLVTAGSLLLGGGVLLLVPELTVESLLSLSKGLLVGLLSGSLCLADKPLVSLPKSLLLVFLLVVLLSSLPLLQLLSPDLSETLVPTINLVGGLLVGTVLVVSLFLDSRLSAHLVRRLSLVVLPGLALLVGAAALSLLNQLSLVDLLLGLLPSLGLLLGLVASLLPLLALRDPEKLLLLRSLESKVLSLN